MEQYTTPLAILNAAASDVLEFSCAVQTPYTPQLTIYSLANAVLFGPANYDTLRNGRLYWHIPASASHGIAAVKTYYKIVIDDDLTGYTAETWMVYVNDNFNYGTMLDRALGLAGRNIRKYAHVWTNGLLTSFQMKIYASASDITTVEAGGADNFTAHYEVTCRYDNNYNRYEITSLRIA
jgi:hypothetical protein